LLHSGQSRRLSAYPSLPVCPDERTSSDRRDMSQTCRQKQTKKAATFDAVWRFSEHHTHPYVRGSDMKNVWDRWPHHDESSKGRAYCGVVVQNYPTKSNLDDCLFVRRNSHEASRAVPYRSRNFKPHFDSLPSQGRYA